MRLIIDTDTAGDDAFSILLALRQPGVTLEALTICNGNVPFDQQVENALITLEVAGRGGSVPVYPGCRLPMLRKPLNATYVFGADGMSNANFPRAKQRPEPKHAVDAIVDLIMANPGEITLLAQAPLTNIALAHLKEPRIAQALQHLWIMGGTDNAIGNVTSAAEFNFYVDPEAAKIVLNAGFKVTLSTWTLTLLSALLPAEDLAEIERLGSPLSKFFLQVNKATVEYSKSRHGRTGSTHPDSLTCACMLDESLILESVECLVDVETAGELTRAYCSVSSPILPDSEAADPALGPARPANARVIKLADTRRFGRMLVDALR
jgi:purine nucleosidase